MARPRTLIPIDRLPLVAGSACLDFVNTIGARANGSPRERLSRYHDLIVWSERAGILEPDQASRLRRVAARQPREAARVLARARALRETLYALFSGLAGGRRPDDDAVRELGRWWQAARSRQELVGGQNGLALRFVDAAELDGVIRRIVVSAVDLLTSDRVRLLKRCGECDWVFLDESKNGTRRWCKAMCGNRARSRQRYERLRASVRRETG